MSPIVSEKKEKKKIPAKYILLLLTILCGALIVVSFRRPLSEKFAESAAGAMLIPLQEGISRCAGFLVEKSAQKKSMEELQTENLRLQAEIDRVNAENDRLMQNRYELTDLRQLYELDEQYGEYEKVGARVIGSKSSNWFYSFILDKGTNDGIRIGMNVLAGSGLCGIISATGDNWSRVEAIIADGSNVSASVLHTQDHLIVSGNIEQMAAGTLPFSQLIDPEEAVKKGDKVVTSNISEKFLPGILIGYVDTVSLDSNQLTCSGTITPVVDFTDITEVLIITNLKELPTDED